ncbi:MAG: hypothetical protein ACR2ML_05405 [Solirubrobacteraceae bacterium]
MRAGPRAAPREATRGSARPDRLILAALLAVIAVGALLRLVWLSDMEYKADEATMFGFSQARDFPGTGLPSGAGIRNPGMSVWGFVILGRGLGIDDPVALARGVALLSIVALALLAAFALRWVAMSEREPWLWAVALVSVNPLGVIFERKIWAQSLLPLLSLGVLAALWRRDSRPGALAWGLLGAWLGQIHMSGFFFAGGFAAWTALQRRRDVRWRWWLAGSGLGALTLIPWLRYLLDTDDPSVRSLKSIVRLDFWRYWIVDAVGVDLKFSLGGEFASFLASPHLGGRGTHLVGALYVALALLGLAVIVAAGRALWPRRSELRDRSRVRALLAGAGTQTGLALAAALVGFGLLLTLSGAIVYRHYLLVAFALPFVSLALAGLAAGRLGRVLLACLCVGQALLSLSFLLYVHDHGGVPNGDYGVAYGDQTPATRPPVTPGPAASPPPGR